MSSDSFEHESCLQAEIFVLVPPGSTIKELDRRKELLKRHVQRVKLTSDPLTDQPDVLQLHNIRSVAQTQPAFLERSNA